jgi:hypothetical protein
MHLRFVPKLRLSFTCPVMPLRLGGRQWAQGRQIQEVVPESMGAIVHRLRRISDGLRHQS